jgi:hypothetical protein
LITAGNGGGPPAGAEVGGCGVGVATDVAAGAVVESAAGRLDAVEAAALDAAAGPALPAGPVASVAQPAAATAARAGTRTRRAMGVMRAQGDEQQTEALSVIGRRRARHGPAPVVTPYRCASARRRTGCNASMAARTPAGSGRPDGGDPPQPRRA